MKWLIFVLLCLVPVWGYGQSVPTQVDLLDGNLSDGVKDRLQFVEVVGQNDDVDTGTDPENVWFDSLYVWLPDTGKTLYLASSSAADTDLVVVVYGLNTSGNLISEQVYFSGGKTHDTLSNTYWRVNGLEILNSDSTNAAVGVISLSDVAADSTPAQTTNLVGAILAGNQKSWQGFYTVPENYAAAFLDYVEIQSASTTAECELWIRKDGEFFKNIATFDVAAGTATFPGKFLKIEPQSDIIIRVKEVGADNAQVNVRIGLWLYAN